MILKTKITIAVVSAFVIIAVSVSLALALGGAEEQEAIQPRTFNIDYNNNSFLLNGEPFQYVSGSFHYFRATPDSWQQKLRTMRSAGLNVVDTYVEWSLHNPKDDEKYNFDGIADLVNFIELAKTEDLLVILRPGPYICAERDNGGLPYWLNTKYPGIQLRTFDSNYIYEVRKWYAVLMEKIQPYLYGNGGPIIMVQIENEYGVYHACDKGYTQWLYEETKTYVEDKAIMFTVDIPNPKSVECGKIDNVFATIDFGIDRAHEMDDLWALLRTVQPDGPLVNSEFYPGWLTHWQEENQRRDADEVANVLRKMLEAGASVNFYMFFGGTNFGFTAGANDWGVGKYKADVTTYDYDAPMDEAGDPTIKLIKIRNVIKDFITLPTLDVPNNLPKMSLEPLNLTPISNLLSESGRRHLGTINKSSIKPLTFEELDQYSGLVLYEMTLPKLTIDPTQLRVSNLRDRALVYVDQHFVGVLSRENAIHTLPISAGFGSKLQILVENQGRINFNITDDTKGISGASIQLYDGILKELENWTITGYPLDDYTTFETLISESNTAIEINKRGILDEGPVVFYKEFDIPNSDIYDTYIDTTGWGKGIIYINGFHIGRYWPLVGPQITMFVPKSLLKATGNKITILEYQKAPIDGLIQFTSVPRIDG